GVACPRAAVAAVAVRGTLDLEKTKKSRAEAESAAWEMCATGKTQDTLQRQLAPRTGHAIRHDAVAFPLAPHPAATDNTSFGPVFKIRFFFFWFLFRSSPVLQSPRRRLCLVARKSIAAASNPSPPPPAYHRHLQPIAAASNPSLRPPTHRCGLQPIAAASDSSPHP
ncbi:hypothetical protein EDB84DRAFT_1485261, partial [Lactarius hengduanensis]